MKKLILAAFACLALTGVSEAAWKKQGSGSDYPTNSTPVSGDAFLLWDAGTNATQNLFFSDLKSTLMGSPGAIGGTSASSAAFTTLTTSGAATLNSLVLSGSATFADNIRLTFNPGATVAGLNVGSHAGDPSTPTNGDLWYDSTANELTARINGANVALGAGGGGSFDATTVDSVTWSDGTNATNTWTFSLSGASDPNLVFSNGLITTDSDFLTTGLLTAQDSSFASVVSESLALGSNIVFEGSSADASETIFSITNPTADRTITFPNSGGTVLLGSSTVAQTIDLGGDTSFEVPNGSAPTTDAFGELAGDNDAWASGRGVLEFFDGTASTNLVGTLASDTPTNGQVPKWNTGGTITWEDDTGAGGAAVATDSIWDAAGDIVYGTGSNTATRLAIGTAGQLFHVNSGATAPEWTSNPSVTSLTATTGNVGSLVFEGSTADASETTIAVVDPTADRTITLPDSDGEVVLNNATEPQTIIFSEDTSLEIPNGSAPTTDAFGEIAADNDAWAASRGVIEFFDGTASTNLVGTLASDTPTNGQVPTWNTGGTITWETVSGGSFDVDADYETSGDWTITGTWDFTGATVNLPPLVVDDLTTTNLIFEGSTADANETTLTVTDPTADRTITLPNATGTVALAEIVTKSTAANYTIGTTDPRELYGGVIYVTSAATITIPAVASGASFTVITIGSVAVSVDPNASDLIYLDGTALSDGDKVTNTSTAGDIAVFTYLDGTGWYCSSNSWTDGN